MAESSIATNSSTSPASFVRQYEPKRDSRIVKMLIGQGVMEGLARANQKVYFHPLSLLLWLASAITIDYFANFLPNDSSPITYLSPLMGFALAALPILGFAEFRHRPGFATLLRTTLGSPDMVDSDTYYSTAPTSGIWVFEHKKELMGVICVDGTRAGNALGTVLGKEEGEVIGKDDVVEGMPTTKSKGQGRREGLRNRVPEPAQPASRIVQIRHLDVDHPVRRKGVATELVVTALDHAFGISSPITFPAETVIVLTNPLTPGGDRIFTKCGFTASTTEGSSTWPKPERIGLLGWQGRWLSLSRDEWLRRRDNVE